MPTSWPHFKGAPKGVSNGGSRERSRIRSFHKTQKSLSYKVQRPIVLVQHPLNPLASLAGIFALGEVVR